MGRQRKGNSHEQAQRNKADCGNKGTHAVQTPQKETQKNLNA